MEAAQKRRLVVWGLGRHGVGKILPAVAEADGVELYGVCSRSAASVRARADAWKCQGWTDPDAMLRDAGVEVVYVGTPIALHAEHGRKVLEAGKHLWCEKPLTSSLADTRALVKAAQTRGLALCEAFMYLHHPQFQQLAGYLADDRVGAVKSVECRFGMPRLDEPGFRSDPAMGGGALFDLGCYPISAINALFPRTTARIVASSVRSSDSAGIDTDGYALLELSNGVAAMLEWRRNAAYRNEIGIWGDRGSLYTDKIFSKNPDYVPLFRFRNIHGDETTLEGTSCNHFVAMFNEFRRMTDDPPALEAERQRITWRSEVLDQIWSAARPAVMSR